MAEKLYEGMFLLDSTKYAQEPEETTQHLLDILDKAGATIAAHRPWQDGKLAYEIDGHRKGLHYLVYFRMPGAGATSITRSCKLSEVVLRHMLINQPETLFNAMVNAISGRRDNDGEGRRSASHDETEAVETEDEEEEVSSESN